MKPFHIRYWGGVQNGGASAKFLGTSENDFWFDTAAEREAFRNKMQRFAKSINRMVLFTERDGAAAQTRTVAVMVFEFDGKEYPLEYDFGVGYSANSAEFMWEEGNYSCDCNRAIFLSEKYPEAFNESERECGDSIDLISFKVEYRDPEKSMPENGQQKDKHGN